MSRCRRREHGAHHVRRSYAYVHGPLKLFRDEPEVVVTSADQVTDTPPGA